MEQSNDQARLDTGTPVSRQPSPTNPASETSQSHQQNTTNNNSHPEQNGQHLELQLANARKELESMVLKYARSEMIVLQNKNKIDDLDKKLKRATKDNETLLSKVKDLNDEKSALLSNLNSKIVHTSRCEQENERLKQDLSIKTERLEVVLNQFETEQEVHQLTKKQLTQAKESIKRLQTKLDQKQKDEPNTDNMKCTSEIKCDSNDVKVDINNKKEIEDHGGLNTSNNSTNGNEVNCDHDSAIFTNTTSDVDSLDHSNDKDKLDGHLESLETEDTATNNHKLEEDDDETVEYDRNLNPVTMNNDNNTITNNKHTMPSGPSLQEQHRVIEMAKLERKIMELKDENQEISNRLKKFEKLYKDSECSLSKSKLVIADSETKIAALSKELDELKAEISKEEQKSSHLEKKLHETELNYADLEKQIESYKSKEGELLEFTERLSLKQAMLQSELSAALQRIPEYEERFLNASKHSEELSKQKESLTKQLHKLRQEIMDEKHLKATLIQEKEAVEYRLTKTIDELQNEIRVMKKKHLNSVKELNKELKNLQNQLLATKNMDINVVSKKTPGSLELKASMSDTASIQSANLTNCPQVSQPDCASSIGSRTSSSTSLEVISAGQNSHSHQLTKDNLVSQDSADMTGVNSLPTENHHSSCKALHDYDKSSLVDWVVKLQRHIVKRDERIDILQEQINQLIEEVKKKGRLLQHFILREESGLLSTDSMEKNKQQLAKRGSGIMSSLYSSSANDSGLTLELSLEINKKLQALLEDTILKNITLKESLSTLGSEIARLNHSDQPRQQIEGR